MNRGPIILSIAAVVGVYAGLHLYMWARLIRRTELPSRWRRRATASLVAVGLYAPLSSLVARWAGIEWPTLLIWPAVLWIGLALYLILALVATDVLRWLAELWLWCKDRERFRAPGTQRWLYRVFATIALTMAVGATATGVITVACGPTVRRVEVRLDELPRTMDGLTIVQLSDLHVGRTIGRAYVESVVTDVNALEPDAVVITGDLADGQVGALRDAVEPLFSLRARHGVYFVTGNHDHYSGAGPWRAHLAAGGIHVLSNASIRIGDEPASIDIVGVEDRRGYVDLQGALAGCDPATPTILLAHRPDMVFEAALADVDLQLSGHTHGGQLWPFTLVVDQAVPYASGLYRREKTWLYVNVGTGYVGPPLRLGTRSEITLVTLRTAGDR
jgi:predicted MPP superfamily phosphohydrolase